MLRVPFHSPRQQLDHKVDPSAACFVRVPLHSPRQQLDHKVDLSAACFVRAPFHSPRQRHIAPFRIVFLRYLLTRLFPFPAKSETRSFPPDRSHSARLRSQHSARQFPAAAVLPPRCRTPHIVPCGLPPRKSGFSPPRFARSHKQNFCMASLVPHTVPR